MPKVLRHPYRMNDTLSENVPIPDLRLHGAAPYLLPETTF